MRKHATKKWKRFESLLSAHLKSCALGCRCRRCGQEWSTLKRRTTCTPKRAAWRSWRVNCRRFAFYASRRVRSRRALSSAQWRATSSGKSQKHKSRLRTRELKPQNAEPQMRRKLLQLRKRLKPQRRKAKPRRSRPRLWLRKMQQDTKRRLRSKNR